LPGSAEAAVMCVGIIQHVLITYCLRNTSAKNYLNWSMYVKGIARQKVPSFLVTQYRLLIAGENSCLELDRPK